MCRHILKRTSNGFRCYPCKLFVSLAEVIGQGAFCRGCKQDFEITQKVMDNNKSKYVLCLNCARKLKLIYYHLNEMKCEGWFDKLRKPSERVRKPWTS